MEMQRNYTSIFKNSNILRTHLHTEAGLERHGQRPGSGTSPILTEYLGSADGHVVDRVLLALMGMEKYHFDELKGAFN